MKKITLVLWAFLCTGCISAIAQEGFEKLKLNSSPAFVLLGIEPDNIQRPSSPSKFIAGLQNAVIDGKLQPNVAFELSPYYMKNPKIEPKRFQARNFMLDQKSVFQTMLRTLSLSLGTTTTDETTFGKMKTGTGIGLGMRFQVIDGIVKNEVKVWNMTDLTLVFYEQLTGKFQSDSISGFQSLLEETFLSFDENVLKKSFGAFSEQELKSHFQNLKTSIETEVKSKNRSDQLKYLENLYNAAKKADSVALAELNASANPLTKHGFMLEVAAGQAYVFEENTLKSGSHAKSAIWLTPSYRFNLSKKDVALLDVMSVFRYTFNNQTVGVDVADYFDAGLKGSYTQGKWSGSIEYVYRHATKVPDGLKKKYTYRLVTGIDYKLSESITFKFNFGTNFDGNTATYTDPKKMFALGGLNFGLADIF